MNIVFFSSKPYDKTFFASANQSFHYQLRFLDPRLTIDTAGLVDKGDVVCAFVNDVLDKPVLELLKENEVSLIALRSAGYNNVDLQAAKTLGINIVNVPAYSPNAVAEHTICLMLALNRKIYRAYSRIREGNFSLDGLLGFDFNQRTAGIIGTGKIGQIVSRILTAFGMQVIAYDPVENKECIQQGVHYVSLDTLYQRADIISLHCPLTPQTKHMINQAALEKMKQNVMIINTSRGAVLDTCAIIDALKAKKIGYLGLDVYEQESELFFEDMSCEIIQDDIFERLLTFHNVLVTAHQGFFTSNALDNIATTTLNNIKEFELGKPLTNVLTA